jgi:hypothetical protein
MAIIYSYPQGTPTLSDNVIGSQIDPITEENKTVQFTVGQIASFANSYSLGYTVYTALLTQAGTAAPVATILQNTTGKTFTYARTSGGDYTVTASSSLFTVNKTIVFLNGGSAENNHDIAWGRVSDTVISLHTHNSDGKFTAGSIEIRAYA